MKANLPLTPPLPPNAGTGAGSTTGKAGKASGHSGPLQAPNPEAAIAGAKAKAQARAQMEAEFRARHKDAARNVGAYFADPQHPASILTRHQPKIEIDTFPKNLTPQGLSYLVYHLNTDPEGDYKDLSFHDIILLLARTNSLDEKVVILKKVLKNLAPRPVNKDYVALEIASGKKGAKKDPWKEDYIHIEGGDYERLAMEATLYINSNYFHPPLGTDLEGIGGTKSTFGEVTRHPIDMEAALSYFNWRYPSVDLNTVKTHGDFDRGLMLYSGVKFVFVRSKEFIFGEFKRDAEGNIIGAHFGGTPGIEHLESTMLTEPNFRTRRDIKTVAQQLMAGKKTSHGHATAGLEWEGWAISQITKELLRIPHKELQEGMFEFTIGEEVGDDIQVDPLKMMVLMADTDAYVRNLDEFSDALLVTSGTLPSGTPQKTVINGNADTVFSRYVGAYSEVIRANHLSFDEMDSFAQFIMDKYAKYHGYKDFDGMFGEHGDVRTWVMAAMHANIAMINTFNPTTGRYEIDANLFLFTLNFMLSEMGIGLAQMMAASGPLYQGVVTEVTDGVVPLANRFFLRNNMGTGGFFNEPYANVENLMAAYRQTLVAKEGEENVMVAVTHTIARGAAGEKQEDASRLRIIHGSGRGRVEDVGGNGGRMEMTPMDATAMVFRTRIMALGQLSADVALLARYEQIKLEEAGKLEEAKNYKVFTFVENLTGLKPDKVFGNTQSTVTDFMLRRDRSTKAKELADKWQLLIEQLKEQYILPGRQTQMGILSGGLSVFREDVDFDGLSQGHGTQGAALRNILLYGFRGRYVDTDEATEILAAWQEQEAAFIRRNRNNPEVLKAYGEGRAGFNFVYIPSTKTKFRSFARTRKKWLYGLFGKIVA